MCDHVDEILRILGGEADQLPLSDVLSSHLVPVALLLRDRHHLGAVVHQAVGSTGRLVQETHHVGQSGEDVLLAWLHRGRSPSGHTIHRRSARIPEAVVVLGPERLPDLREDPLVAEAHDVGISRRIHVALVGQRVRRRATVVGVQVDVGMPLVDHLGDQSADLLGLQLDVVPVHVEALFIRPPPHLGPVRVDRGDHQNGDFVQEGSQVTHHQVPHDLHGGVFAGYLAAVDVVHDQDDGLVGIRHVLGLEDRRVREDAQDDVAPSQRLGELHHAHELCAGLQIVDEVHQGSVKRAPLLVILALGWRLQPLPAGLSRRGGAEEGQ